MSGQLRKLAVGYEQLRSLVIEYLAESKDDPTLQINNLRTGVATIAVRKGLDPDANHVRGLAHQVPISFGGDVVLSDPDFILVVEIIWDLIIEGVVRPGDSLGGSLGLPHFHLTERGIGVLKNGVASPYDPDGYLKRLDSESPGLDPIIRIYVTESLDTFRIGSLLSSAITLGCASECAILNLIDAYAKALPPAKSAAFRKKTEGKTIKVQFDELTKMIDGHLKGCVPREIKENLDLDLNAIFGMLRIYRNEAGHPTGRRLSREQAYANLAIFPHYIKHLYSLITWMNDNTPLT